MRRPHVTWRIATIAGICLLALVDPVAADPDCRAAGNIASGLQNFIRDFETADQSGHGTLGVQDFLVGVSGIRAEDLADLNRRGATKVATSNPGAGAFANDGRLGLEFEGIFARRQTFFKVPQQIRGRYVISANSVALYYDVGGAIQLGEAIPLVGIPVFRTVNHVVVTRNKLLFFWGNNASGDADRCYVAG